MKAFRAIVEGHVQGIGFRYVTRRVADQLGLAGWVLNRPDGSVEVWAQGAEDSLTRLSAFLEQGPSGAVVTSVEVKGTTPDPTLEHFEVRL